MAQKRRQPKEIFIPDVPAAIKEGHVQEVKGYARGRYRQTKADPLRSYADAGQITEEQYVAGDWYADRVKEMAPAGHTKFERAPCGGQSFPITDIMADATKKVISVDSHLSEENRTILRKVLWEGFSATEAVREATGETSKHYPIPRLREALEKLTTAIARAKASGWKFRLTPVNSGSIT